ncbi:MAG: kelch repeat-containing protein [Candidatus Hodarchaeota archaeon]
MLPVTNVVQEYDPAANSWTSKASMPTARMGPAAAVIRDTIYVFGGSTSVGSGATTVHECYDPNTNNWASRANLPSARYALGGFSHNNVAYAIGGYNYTSYFTNVDVYDPSTNSWSSETPMQYARQSIAVGLVGTNVYVIGGWNNGALNYNEEGLLTIGIEENQTVQNLKMNIGPNPFSKQTKISFGKIPSDENIELKIYDITGRLVKNFSRLTLHGQLPTHITWDGKDDNGIILPSGTYLLVINNQGVKETRILNFIH